MGKSINDPDLNSVQRPNDTPIRVPCPNHAPNFRLWNTQTGELVPLPCNKYSCPVCGRKKLQKLYSALNRYFSQFKYIRLWTFTLSSTVAVDRINHYKILSECWRRFVTELRRSKYISKKMRLVSYVRVCEPHVIDSDRPKLDLFNDYFHFHVLFTEFIPIDFVMKIWEHICQEYCQVNNHIASCWVKGMVNCKAAAKYVCKYVSKGASLLSKFQKKWTKSSRVSIFDRQLPTGIWKVISYSWMLTMYEKEQLGFDPFTCIHNNQLRNEWPANLPKPPPIYSDFFKNHSAGENLNVETEFELIRIENLKFFTDNKSLFDCIEVECEPIAVDESQKKQVIFI